MTSRTRSPENSLPEREIVATRVVNAPREIVF